MSLNPTPGLGKSGISLMRSFSARDFVLHTIQRTAHCRPADAALVRGSRGRGLEGPAT